MHDLLGEGVPELGVEPEDVDEAGHVEALEVAVGEGAHVAGRLDDHLRAVRGGQVAGEVAADQVPGSLKSELFPCNLFGGMRIQP